MENRIGRVKVGDVHLRSTLEEDYDSSLSDMPDRREGDPYYDDTIPLISGEGSKVGGEKITSEIVGSGEGQ